MDRKIDNLLDMQFWNKAINYANIYTGKEKKMDNYL